MKFQVRDKIKQVKGGWNTAIEDNEKEAFVTEIGLNYTSNDNGIKIKPIGSWNWKNTGTRGEDAFELVTNNKGGEEGMVKKVIAANFKDTDNANLVEKHLGDQIGSTFIDGLVVAANKDAILGEAVRLEKEELKKKS